jgi:hypothetical protein
VVIPSDLAAFLEGLALGDHFGSPGPGKLLADLEPHLFAGLVNGAFSAFPESAEWDSEPGHTIWEKAFVLGPPEQTAEWNQFFLGKFAYLGADADLAELIRRARHRDGSTASIVLGSAACALLDSAAADCPELLKKLLAMGYNPAAVNTGYFPGPPFPGVEPIHSPADVPAAGPAVSLPFTSDLPPAPIGNTIAGPAAANDPPEVAVGVVAVPDMTAGAVVLSGMVSASISITAALNLLVGLTESTQRLFLPKEGYMWVDDIDHLAGALIVLDKVLAERLGLPERSGLYALRAGLPSVWLAGELTQSEEQGQFGLYHAVMMKPNSGGSFDQFGAFPDFNTAKFELAKRVRESLAALGI